MISLDYPVTRPFTLRYFKAIFLVGALVLTAVATVIAVIAVGYELVPVSSTSFNLTSDLWYECVVPKASWAPKTRECDGYVDWFVYSNTALQNCSVQSMTLTQSAYAPVEDEV